MGLFDFSLYRGKTILVTGSQGFIARALIEQLIIQGADVIGTLGPGAVQTRRTLQDGTPAMFKQVRYASVDFSDPHAVSEVMDDHRPDIVFHLAGRRGLQTAEALIQQSQVSLIAALNVLYAAVKHGPGMFIHVGSVEEYGAGEIPFSERQMPQPISPYSAGKVAANAYVLMAHRAFGLNCIIVRPSVVYGPNQHGSMLLPTIINAYLKKQSCSLSPGEQNRDFLYIDDCVNGLMLAGLRQDLSGQVFNLGAGKSYNLKFIAALVAQQCGYDGDLGFGRITYQQNEIMDYYVDISTAESKLKWRPTVDIEEGLARTIAAWRQLARHNSTPNDGAPI